MNLQEHFGELVFDKKMMKKKLPYPVYLRWKNAIRKEDVLDEDTADIIAHAMKEWALDNGCTHYSHWFFPLHGETAKKHESLLSRNEDGDPIVRFSGKELIKGEPDASSFPSGGLRATFEARGYTYWDASSYAFIMDHVLYIPSVFVAYSGDTLDMKGPLLRAHDLCSKNATRVLNAIHNTHTWRVRSHVGMEQEFFLVDKTLAKQRKDLLLCGKTVLGAPAIRGQSLEDHYLGAMPERVLSYLDDVNERLWRLGVYVTTAHNEVAPCQFEIAPLHEHCNVAVDDNHMIMDVLRTTARAHGLVCLMHEKPFRGVNGSGKHNNWSLVSNFGENCFDPGEQPQTNLRFLLFVTAVIEAVDRWQNLFRYSASTPGNDERLGAAEAPPAVISVTMGNFIDRVLREMIDPVCAESEPENTQLSVSYLESVPYDDSDRNRTSPFAFTGNKFEFRMPGSSKAAAEVNIALNAAVGAVLGEYADRLEHEPAEDIEELIREMLTKSLTAHQRILFNGDGYGDAWRKEAERRGLLNAQTHLEALQALRDDNVRSLYTEYGIYTEKELEALYEIALEEFVHVRLVEIRTLLAMARREVVSSVTQELTALENALGERAAPRLKAHRDKISEGLERIFENLDALEEELEILQTLPSVEEQAFRINNETARAAEHLRGACDDVEPLISEDHWRIPTYDILFTSL